jgi:carbamoyltransferase
MKILGLHFETHESSVALIENDKILFAASEERYSRIKMDESFPVLSIKNCLMETRTQPKDIDIIAISGFSPLKNWFFYLKSFLIRKLFTKGKYFSIFERHSGTNKVVFKGIVGFFFNILFCTGLPQFIYIYLLKRLQIRPLFKGFRGKIVYVSHHFGHSAGACFTSGFNDALSVVIEGFDWEHSFVIEEFENGRFKTVSQTPWPHSPGSFYRLATTILGFNYRRHAGKVTGLAAHGDPNKLYEKVKRLLFSDGLNMKTSPLVYTLCQEYVLKGDLPGYFAGSSKEDIAAAFQKRLEDVTVQIIKRALKITGKNQIVLSGGVSANVIMNQNIHEIDGIKEIYIQPAMSDSGQALGIALYTYNEELKMKNQYLKSKRLNNVYFGPGFSDSEIKEALIREKVKFIRSESIAKDVAVVLADKKIVARFDARMEYGPRALGNRSILFHAGDKTSNDWLNKNLNRTEFMPFAPSVLIDDLNDYFLNTTGAEYTAEFMNITFNCTEKMKNQCPAVVHIDGTARPNIVKSTNNSGYYKIIKEYKKLTGIGVILNTSFNMHEEPIVCTPEDAIRSFVRGHLDYLAIGNYLVRNDKSQKNQ